MKLPFPSRPARSTESEWMDAPGHPRWLIDDNLVDLRRVNRLLGGIWLTLRPLEHLAAQVPHAETLRVLDVATGSGDIPREIARWARRQGRRLFCVASDVGFEIVRSGRDYAAVPEGMVFVVADATRLPFRNGAFHVAASSLALHHLLPDEAVAMFREQSRCARTGVVVNDVERSWLSYAGAIVATRLGSRNPLTLHDGPLSVRRAFTVAEMSRLLRQAGLRAVAWWSFLFYRVSFAAVPVRAADSA